MDDTEFLFELSRVESKLMGYAMALTQYCTDDARNCFKLRWCGPIRSGRFLLPVQGSILGLNA